MDNYLDARVYLILMAARMVGDYVYSWGGEEIGEGGFDCSGFTSVVLMQTARAWPKLYTGGRNTASGLYEYYDKRDCPDISEVADLRPGCLVFYRRPGKGIHHIALHTTTVPPVTLKSGKQVEVGPIALESGGGNSSCTSPRAALRRSAGVRITASDFQSSDVEWVAKDPFLLLSRA